MDGFGATYPQGDGMQEAAGLRLCDPAMALAFHVL
jgi:hypothetical protein